MKSIEISLGHAAMHSPWLVQAPNPSASICATMPTTRVSRSGCPWGRSPRGDTFAATNSMAEALGQAATQAPHLIQPAPAIARSASRFVTSRLSPPVAGVDERPRPDDPIDRPGVRPEVLDHRERPSAPRLDPQLGPVRERAHV